MSNATELSRPHSTHAPCAALVAVPTRPGDPMHGGDTALVRALLANDPDAFRELWQRFFPVVSARLRRVLGSDVEDVVQEVFMNLLCSIQRLRQPQALTAFVLAITRHTASRELRRRRTRPHLSLELVPLEMSAVGFRDATARHAFGHLEIVLGRLKERDRLAFTLRYVERRNVREVADALGVSVATATRCFAHAWKRVAFFADRNLFLSDYLGEAGSAMKRTPRFL